MFGENWVERYAKILPIDIEIVQIGYSVLKSNECILHCYGIKESVIPEVHLIQK